jgi:hypothetical protein
MSAFSNPPRYAAETARAYVAALFELLGDRDVMETLAATPAALRGAVAGLDADAARVPEAAGKWSVQQVIRHLSDSEIVFAYRVRLIVAADRPGIPGYDQDEWANRLGYHEGTVAEAIEDFEAMRWMNLRWLRARTPAELARIGMHSERGEESVEHVAKLMAGHDLTHLRQIERIKAAVGVSPRESGAGIGDWGLGIGG